MNLGSRDSLKVRLRCGLRLCNCQSRFTVLLLTPWALAMVRQLQCVIPLGLVSSVARIKASRFSSSYFGLRPRPAWISQTEPIPLACTRSRHSATVCRLTSWWEAISRSGYPSAAARTNRQRKRSEEHTSELQSRENLVCRLLLEKKKKKK